MIHSPDCDCDAYACEMRRKGVQVSTVATPNRIANRKPPVMKFKDAPSWEAGRVGHRNADGTFVPVINEAGQPLRVKEYGERRAHIDKILDRKRRGIVDPS